MRSTKMLLKIFGSAFAQLSNGYSRCVARDQCAGFADRLDALKQLLFDVQPFNNDLNDPVAFVQLLQVVIKVPCLDSLRESFGVQGRWI